MPNALNAYYDAATALLAARPEGRAVMSGTAECLKKTYIMMQAALGTEASLEIGARGAEYSLEMANTYGGAIALCALEASPRTHAYFSKEVNYKQFGVRYINALIAEHDGKAVFYEYVYEGMEAAAGMSSILVRDIKKHGAARRTRSTIKSIRGDTFIEGKFKKYKKIALWIDVEGAQAEVLYSLSGSFARGIINAVYIEVEKKKLWLEQRMLDNDVIAFMHTWNFSPFLRDNEYDTQYNIIFVNNNVQNCDFSFFFEQYRGLLQQGPV
ncbi:MAG: FkbM family methyltransferase [Deltaproteobacteria bacterium]|jgi:FkbM family methyltransferase|nr:FkbM family methyltransferase [Deltaproteobacteria bacterium]